jgi:hypothetical protein
MHYLFVIKNFFRNDFVNLTAQSIKHFIPNAKVSCLNLYKDKIEDYKNQPFLNVDEIFYRKTKYDSKGRGGVANPDNSLFFAEGYNYIYEQYKFFDGKILMLAEDHFFTNGQTLNEFIHNDFDIAYAKWGDGANGSILGLNLTKNIVFPIPERTIGGVEGVFQEDIVNKSKNSYCFSTRDGSDYKNDGFYSNDINEIKNSLIQHKIL